MDIEKTQIHPQSELPQTPKFYQNLPPPQMNPMNMYVNPFQQQYQPPPPPPQQYGYNPQPNMYGFAGYQQPQPPQGGFFNNFVMNNLQMGMNQNPPPQQGPNRHSYG